MSAREAGFTLVELAVTIAIAAILAAFAAATISTRAFDTEGYYNRALAMVRYAQKIAIAQRRTVAVDVSAGNLKLCYTACPGIAVREPPGTSAFSHNTPSGVTLGGTIGSFTFDSQGRPSSSGTIVVTGDGSRTITIEAETGYVR